MSERFNLPFKASPCRSPIRLLRNRWNARGLPVGLDEWRYVKCSYSQFGEDLLILSALDEGGWKGPAYYVDAGAFDPVMLSNTLRLSQMGWKGINIDPNPLHIQRFLAMRSHDINLPVAVAAIPGLRNFLLYTSEHDPTGHLEESAEITQSLLGETPESAIEVETLPLAAILDRYLPKDSMFGFLNVDCEGSDLEVLKSNDWSRYRPWVIAVEDHVRDHESKVENFCVEQGYRLFAQAHITKIFVPR